MNRELSDIEKEVASTETSENERRKKLEELKLRESSVENPEQGEENLSEAEKIHRVELAARESEAKVVQIVGEGNEQNLRFLEKAQKFGVPLDVVKEVLGSESANIHRLSEGREATKGGLRKNIAKITAFVLGVGGAGVQGTPKAFEISMGMGAENTMKRIVEGIPGNPILKKMLEEKATKKTQIDAERIGIVADAEEGGVGGRAESTTEDLTKRLEAQTEALKRQMEESGAEEAVETPEEREERMDEARNEWEDKKAAQNAEAMDEAEEKNKRNEEAFDVKENEKAVQMERAKIQEELDRDIPKLQPTFEALTEYLRGRCEKDTFEVMVVAVKTQDGKMRVLSANPSQYRVGGGPEPEKKIVSLSASEIVGAQEYYLVHTHPKEVVKSVLEHPCDTCGSVTPPSITDLNFAQMQEYLSTDVIQDLYDLNKKSKGYFDVVTNDGVWRFAPKEKDSLGFSYVRDKMQQAEEKILNGKEKKSFFVSLGQTDGERMQKYNELLVAELAKNGDFNNAEIGKNILKYQDMQLHLESSDASIQDFINRYGDDVDFTFTRFDKNGKFNSKRTIEKKDFGWGDK